MTRRISFLVCALVAVAALGPAVAATEPAPPTIEFFSPRTAEIGDTLTVTGRNYLPGSGRSTLVFLSPSGPAVFVKAYSATRSQLKVRIPERLLNHFNVGECGELKRTVFRLRVLARRTGRRFTPRRISLAVLPPANSQSPGATPPADCASGGAVTVQPSP